MTTGERSNQQRFSSTTSHPADKLQVKGRRSHHPDKRQTNIPESVRATMMTEERKKSRGQSVCAALKPELI